MKDSIKEVILEFHKEPFPTSIKRAIQIKSLPKNIRKAQVFIGMRRVGKTYLMYQHMQDKIDQGLAKNKMIYINFEDDRLQTFNAGHFQLILEAYYELYPQNTAIKDIIIYFDEIQIITDWEKFIRRLIDKETIEIYITGSSAKLLSIEIATSLRGRSLSTEVFPLSFLEYLNYHQITEIKKITTKEKAVIKHHCQQYLLHGGFPEIIQLPEQFHRQIIQNYVTVAVFRDVIDRHKLNNPHMIKMFLIHCLQNLAAPLSITKVYKTFKSRGEILSRSNLYAYLEYFIDAYLLFSVPLFEFSTRKRQVNPSKIYCVDTGIIRAFSIKPEMERAATLENAVFLHLRRNSEMEIYYYKTPSGKEVDFLAKKITGQIELIQACVDIYDEKTKSREISALLEAAETLDLTEAWIITSDTVDTIAFKNVVIHVMPYWQWVTY